MATKRVLIAWELGGGLGHLTRLQPLVASLVETGFEVTLAVPSFHNLKDALGGLIGSQRRLRVIQAPVPKPLDPAEFPPPAVHTLADVLVRRGLHIPERLFTAANHWHHILNSIKPSLTVSDFSPVLNFVTRKFAPLLVLGNGYTIPPSDMPLPPLLPWKHEVPEASRQNETAILKAVNIVCRANRLEPVVHLANLFRGQSTFVCTLPELDPYRGRRTDTYWSPPNIPTFDDIQSLHARPTKRILVYLPGNHPQLRNIFEAAEKLDLAGSAYLPAIAHDLKSSLGSHKLAIHGSPVSLSDQLPRVRLVVHHGGLATAHAALKSGTPQIVLPQSTEHYITSCGLGEFGACAMIPSAAEAGTEIFIKVFTALLEDPDVLKASSDIVTKCATLDPIATREAILGSCLGFLA